MRNGSFYVVMEFKKENKYIANYERIVTVSIAGGWIMDGRHMEVMSHMSW